MKKNILKISLSLVCTITNLIGTSLDSNSNTVFTTKHTLVEWTVVCYMHAYDYLNQSIEATINDMQKIGSNKGVNILVQWSKPSKNKTDRFLVEKTKRAEINSFNWQDGMNPELELVEMMKWASINYPAKNYMLILWNRGNSLFNTNTALKKNFISDWLQSFEIHLSNAEINNVIHVCENKPNAEINNATHVFENKPEAVFLDNQALSRVCHNIKATLGKNIDVLLMDSDMMATAEIANNLKDTVNLFIGSQEVIPESGWTYSTFLKTLTEKPSLIKEQILCNSIVYSYVNCQQDNPNYTFSAITTNKINLINKTLDNVVYEITKCYTINAEETAQLLQETRINSIEFHTKDYIDLYSFYTALATQLNKIKSNKALVNIESNSIPLINLKKLDTVLGTAKNALLDAVNMNLTGSKYSHAKGMSIYYPTSNELDPTYEQTPFAQNTQWLSLLKLLGKA